MNKVLSKFYLDKTNTVNTLIKEITLLQPRTEGKSKATAVKNEKYQRMTSSIMFSIVERRPNISFTTSVAN